MPLCGYLCQYVGWESVFYVTGASGIIWFVLWALLVHDGPGTHPAISQGEREFLQISSTEDINTRRPGKIPWGDIATSVPVWAIIATHVTQSFGYYVLLTELPNYMKNVLGWDLGSKGFLSGLPYLAMWIVSMVASIAVDYTIESKSLSTSTVRKLANSIAAFGPAIALLGEMDYLTACFLADVKPQIL